MVNLKSSDLEISLLEKCVINFALPGDFIYRSVKSYFFNDRYSKQTPTERLHGMCGKAR